MAGGATDVIHKDDVDSVRVAEAVDRARSELPPKQLSLMSKVAQKFHSHLCLMSVVSCRTRAGLPPFCCIDLSDDRLGHSLMG